MAWEAGSIAEPGICMGLIIAGQGEPAHPKAPRGHPIAGGRPRGAGLTPDRSSREPLGAGKPSSAARQLDRQLLPTRRTEQTVAPKHKAAHRPAAAARDPMGNASKGHDPGQITLLARVRSELQLHRWASEVGRDSQVHGHVFGRLEAETIERAPQPTP